MDTLLDENYLNKLNETAIDLDADHFGREEDPFRGQSQQEGFDSESTMKVLLFIKIQERDNAKWKKMLKQRLEVETDQFISLNSVDEKDKFKQLLRNLTELVEQPEVQFPSFYQIVRNKQHEHIGNDLSVILFYLIRGDECNNHSKESDDKDKMRLQCIILYKNLQTTGVMGNIAMQCKILSHIIERVKIEIYWILHGEETQQKVASKFENGGGLMNDFIGFDNLSLANFCAASDLKQFQESIDIEKNYCNKIKHAFDLTKFILEVKPFVCLNYDTVKGFTLVRQDRCDKHQANPLLTG